MWIYTKLISISIVVDGRLLDWEALRSLLEPYEGWGFELHIPFEQS